VSSAAKIDSPLKWSWHCHFCSSPAMRCHTASTQLTWGTKEICAPTLLVSSKVKLYSLSKRHLDSNCTNCDVQRCTVMYVYTRVAWGHSVSFLKSWMLVSIQCHLWTSIGTFFCENYYFVVWKRKNGILNKNNTRVSKWWPLTILKQFFWGCRSKSCWQPPIYHSVNHSFLHPKCYFNDICVYPLLTWLYLQ